MTHPMTALRELFQKYAQNELGVVQSIAGTMAKVRTRAGIVEVPTNGIVVSPGSRVTVSEAGVVGVLRLNLNPPTYDV